MLSKILPGLFIMIFALVGVFSNTTQAFAITGYGGDPVLCTMIATPDTIASGEGTTLSWTVSENVVSAVLSGKEFYFLDAKCPP